MSGGSHQQAVRRSTTDASTGPEGEGNILHVGGNAFELVTIEPNREQIIGELARKRVLNMLLPKNIKELIEPAVKDRALIVETIKMQSTAAMAEKVAESIPTDILSKMS
jgi:hypothetical protein